MVNDLGNNMKFLGVRKAISDKGYLSFYPLKGREYVYYKKSGSDFLLFYDNKEKGTKKVPVTEVFSKYSNKSERKATKTCRIIIPGIRSESKYGIYQNDKGFLLRPIEACTDVEVYEKDRRKKNSGYICNNWLVALQEDLLTEIPGVGDIIFTFHTKKRLWIEITRGKCDRDGRSISNYTLEELDGVSYRPSIIRNRTTINKTFLDACDMEPGKQLHIARLKNGNLVLRPFFLDDVSGGLLDTYKDVFSTLNVSSETKRSIDKARNLIDFSSEASMIKSAKRAIKDIKSQIAEIRKLIDLKGKEA